jgi:predicted DNA binding CopG/RHH family protein
MTRRPTIKPTPRFRSEAEEREFWDTHDTTEYVDWSRATRAVFPNLKPSTETISLRLPASLLAELKTLANKRDVPYQSLLKVYLAERVARERLDDGEATRTEPLDWRGASRSRKSSGRVPRRARG